MPTFLVELNDGRKFQVEANRQPTPEEAMSLIGGGQIAPSESKPYLSQLGEALSTGYGQMTSGVGATFNAITGDVPDVAENLAEMGRLQRKQQSSRSAEDIALAEDFARSKEAYEMSQGPLEAMEALGGYLGATARNPGAAFKQAVQSAPNALIGGATELAGYALGGLAGGAAGIETGPGAILTGIAGATAGGAISNSLMEAGPAIYDILNEKTGGAAANMTAGEITAYLNQNPDILSEGLKTGAIRGSVIGLVEGLGLKGAGALATIPERAAARAVQKTLVDAGVDVASKEAIETAVKNPTIFAAVKQAGETAKQQFSSAGNLARMAGAAGIEVGSSGVGELGAQVATGQPVNPTDIYQEMLGEAALSLPVAAAGKALEARKYILPSKAEEAMPPPPPEIEVASDALNATANVPFTDISGQAASDTIAQNTELAMRMPVQPVEEVEEVEEVAEDSADPEFLQKRWQSLEDSALAVIEAGAMDRLPAIRDEQARLAKRIARITAMKTPSPEMEMPEKPTQTITGSNVQTGTEIPVPDKSSVTSPGEAPLVTPEEKKSADNAEVELIEPTVENIKVPTPYVTGNGGQRGEIVAENGDRITVEWRDGTTTTVNKNEVIPRTAIQQIIKNKTEIAQTSTSNSDKFTVFYYDENGKMHHLGEFSGETEDARDRAFEKAFALAEENAREHNHADVHYGKKKFPVKKSTSKVSKTTESPLVTPEEESLAAQRRANLLSAAADAAKGKTKAQVSPVVTAMMTPQQPTQQENAVQEQITDEGVLRQERPEMELQGMGEQNVQPQETATEGQIQEEIIAAPGESEQGTLYGKPSKLTDKDRGQAVSLAKTLQPGDVVETNDGQEISRYKVVVEDGTRLLRKIDQRGDIIEGVREKFLANPARTSSQGELAAIPDGRDTIDVIARGRIIRSGSQSVQFYKASLPKTSAGLADKEYQPEPQTPTPQKPVATPAMAGQSSAQAVKSAEPAEQTNAQTQKQYDTRTSLGDSSTGNKPFRENRPDVKGVGTNSKSTEMGISDKGSGSDAAISNTPVVSFREYSDAPAESPAGLSERRRTVTENLVESAKKTASAFESPAYIVMRRETENQASGEPRVSRSRDGFVLAVVRENGRVELQPGAFRPQPITPQGKPTPATEGKVTPGGVASPGVARDTSKPEPLSTEEVAALRIAKLKGAEHRGDGVIFVPEKLMTPERRKATQRGGKAVEVRAWADVTGVPSDRGYAILDRRARRAFRENKPVSAAAVDAYQITLPKGYVRQGDLYVFQPSLEQSGLGASAATTPQGAIESPTAPKAETSLVNQLNAAKSRQEAQAILESATAEQVKEAAQEMGYPATGSKKAVVSRLVAAVGSRADAKAIRQQSPQTTQAAAETQTPESLRVDSGAAGVVQSEPSRGSILEVEKESAKTAIESTEKSLESGYVTVVKESRDLLRVLGNKNSNAQTAIESRLRKLSVKELQDAFELVTGTPTKLTDRTQLRNNVLNALLEERIKPQIEAADKTFASAEREAEEELQRAESIARLFDKERKNPVKGQVSNADVQQAAGIVGNNGTVPSAPFTWMGNAADLLAMRNTPFARAFPGAMVAATVPNVEGVYENGMAFVFTDQVVVTDLDRRKAAEDNVSPSVAAAMRVITHENYHKGLALLPAKQQADIMAFLRSMFPAEELDALARSYRQYADWRTNAAHEMALLDERLQKYIEETKTIPTDGVWKQFWDYIKAIWRKWTGKPQGEPTLQSMKDVVRLIRKALKDAHKQRRDQTKGGDRVLMSYAGEKAIENLPEERRQFMRDSLDTAKAMAAAGKDREEIRAVTGWFPGIGKGNEKLRWEIPDEGASFREEEFVEVPPPDTQRGYVRNGVFYPDAGGDLYVVITDNKPDIMNAGMTREEAVSRWYEAYAPGKKRRVGGMKSGKLSEVLNHPALFNAYPELADVVVTQKRGFFDIFGEMQGWFNPKTNTINVTPNAENPLSTILHEIQHWIQKKEGFAKGSNTESAMRELSPSQKQKTAEQMRAKAEELITREEKNIKNAEAILDILEKVNAAEFDYLVSAKNKAEDDFSHVIKKYEFGAPERSSAYEETKKANEELLSSVGISNPLSNWDVAYAIKTATSLAGLRSDTLKKRDNARETIIKHNSLLTQMLDSDEQFEKAVKAFDLSYELYRNVAGEIEARDVQARKDLTPEQRAATAPYSSENIAPEDAIVLFGGGPQMSVSGTSQFVPAVNLNGRIETGTSHYEAWLKHAIRQIPSYKKDGLSDSEVKDLADRWLVDHPEAMANSMTKEGFVTDEGYLNRQDSLKKFLALGGKQRLDPGEVRDWLDSSDIEDARFSISYASETSQASSLGQQTAREMTASPRKLEAIIGVRQAYESMPKVHGNAVSLAELFDAAAKIVPNLTQVEFNSVVQGMYEDNAALLNTGAMSSEKPSPGGLSEAEVPIRQNPKFLAAQEADDLDDQNRIATQYFRKFLERVKDRGWQRGDTYHSAFSRAKIIKTGRSRISNSTYLTVLAELKEQGPSAEMWADREDLAWDRDEETGLLTVTFDVRVSDHDATDSAKTHADIDVDVEKLNPGDVPWLDLADTFFPELSELLEEKYFGNPESSRAAGGTSQFNVLNRDNEPALSVVILPGRGMASLGTALSPDSRFSIASTPEQQSAAAKFKSAIIEAAKGTNKQRDYEGRPIKDRIINPLSSDVQDFVEIGQHNTVAFGAFMDAADEMLESMAKDGMSLDEILSKIQSSSFQQELGMFTVEAGQGMAMKAVMGLLLRKTANAERSAKTKAEKIQSSMLHRKAANYFTAVASTPSGQNLYALQALYNDPRTRFIFMENRALADMLKKADHGVNLRFDGAYGATQEATDTNVNASAMAATKNIADQAEEAEEDDQDAIDLAAGEATLKDPEKSLYEEYKDLLREEGILARLDREEAETGAKMSISPERRSELAGLTKEERAKLREKNKQRRMEILSKLLGREEDAKTPEQKATRKKREKMAQTAQKRAQKGKEIEVTPTSLGKIINQARRDIKGPTGKPIQWREIFRQPAKSVEEFRKNILLAIMGNDAFKDMDDAQKRQIADMFAEAWGKEREKVLNQLQKRHEDNLEAQGKREAAKALREARNQILEIANLGVFSNDELTRILGEKFGFKTSFTEAEQQKLSELAEKIQDESLSKPVRNKLAREFLATLQSGTQISIAELLSNWWVASVLSGGNTITAIALSFTNGTGIGILGTHIARAIRNMVKGDTAGAIEAITSMFKAYAKHIASFPSAANRAWNYLWTGDVSLLEASANDPFKNVRSLADIARYQIVADQVAKDPNKVKAVMGRFMQFMGRLLSALDAFNVMITKAGTTSLAIRQSGLTADQIRDAELKNDLKFYKDKIIREDPYFNGKAPTSSFDKAYLASLAEAALYKDLAEFGVKMENADYLAAEAAMTMTPTGVGGIVYNKIKALDKDITTESRERLKQAEKAWAAEKDIDTGLKLFTWRALNFLAEQGINALGLRFARFAGNKFNQSLSYIPVLGALRVFETGNKELAGREEAFKDTIIRNQTIGFIMIIAGMKIIEAIADEPDDKKRGWFINGGWNNLTPDQKKQRLSLGEKQYTIGIGDQVFNYQNWPIGQAIAAIGELSDMIRFSPEKWKEKTTVGKFGSSLVSGMTSALEIPALTQVGEIFGNTMAAKDPSEQTISRLSRVMAGWAGGFMPRFLKDIDYMLKPEMRKYESFYEKAASHIPIYRSYVGKEYYDILGNQIKKNAIPGSRDFDRLAQEPEYKMLGALNARGIWLTPANAEYRMIGKGRYRRRLTQEEADRYSLETGKLYKQMIMRFGPRALQMPVEQAKDYISAKADDMRDLALLKAVRN